MKKVRVEDTDTGEVEEYEGTAFIFAVKTVTGGHCGAEGTNDDVAALLSYLGAAIYSKLPD